MFGVFNCWLWKNYLSPGVFTYKLACLFQSLSLVSLSVLVLSFKELIALVFWGLLNSVCVCFVYGQPVDLDSSMCFDLSYEFI